MSIWHDSCFIDMVTRSSIFHKILYKQCFILVPLYLSHQRKTHLNATRKDRASGHGRGGALLSTRPFTYWPHPLEELPCGLHGVRDSNWTVTAGGSGPCASRAPHAGATCPQAPPARCLHAANTAWLLAAHWPATLSCPDSTGHGGPATSFLIF